MTSIPKHAASPGPRPGRSFAFAVLTAGAAMMAALACGSSNSNPTGHQSAQQLLAAGLTAQRAGQFSVAITDYQKVLQLDPKNKYAYYDLGLIYQQQGNNAQAESDYRSSLAIDPNFQDAVFNLAILRTTAAPQEALELYQHAIQLNPTWAEAHLNLGFLLIQLGQKSQGKLELAKAVKFNPSLISRVPKDLLPLPTPTP